MGDLGRSLVCNRRTNRRVFVGGSLGLAGATLASTRPGFGSGIRSRSTIAAAATATAATQPSALVHVFPIPDSKTASPTTEISFRGINPAKLGKVTVVGSESGWRGGVVLPHADQQGCSVLPDIPFRPGEQVTITTGLDIAGGQRGTFSFSVSRPGNPPVRSDDRQTTGFDGGRTFHSRPDLIIPTFHSTVVPNAKLADGRFFWGPITNVSQNGSLILDSQGEPVWFQPLALAPGEVLDFRQQTYRGKPVLSWWEGISAGGHGLGHGVIVDQTYQPVMTVRVGNGYAGSDLHELKLTERETALFTVFNVLTWDLSAIGGSPNSTVVDGIAQELDLATGRVLFEWHSLDHIAIDETYAGYAGPTQSEPFDYFHINSIDVDHDDNLIISARNTWAIYKIDRATGDVIWRLGGKRSDYKMGDGTTTAYQHDARRLANGDISVFDNGASPKVHDQSRGLVMRLDDTAKTATLVQQYVHPQPLLAGAEGNMQALPNGNFLVGWGDNPYFSEFSASGELLQDVSSSARSYRAYRLPWTGRPTEPPAVAAVTGPGTGMTVFASWNGATEVASWQILIGASPDQLQTAGAVPRKGFETAATVSTASKYVAVEARDSAGQVLGRSQPVAPTAS